MYATKTTAKPLLLWRGSTLDNFTLQLTQSGLSQVMAHLTKQPYLKDFVAGNYTGNLPAAVASSLARLTQDALYVGTISDPNSNQKIRVFESTTESGSDYQILALTVSKTESTIISVRLVPQREETEYFLGAVIKGLGTIATKVAPKVLPKIGKAASRTLQKARPLGRRTLQKARPLGRRPRPMGMVRRPRPTGMVRRPNSPLSQQRLASPTLPSRVRSRGLSPSSSQSTRGFGSRGFGSNSGPSAGSVRSPGDKTYNVPSSSANTYKNSNKRRRDDRDDQSRTGSRQFKKFKPPSNPKYGYLVGYRDIDNRRQVLVAQKNVAGNRSGGRPQNHPFSWHYPGQDVFPGGKKKPGEQPQAASIREFREETGVDLQDDTIRSQVGSVGDPDIRTLQDNEGNRFHVAYQRFTPASQIAETINDNIENNRPLDDELHGVRWEDVSETTREDDQNIFRRRHSIKGENWRKEQRESLSDAQRRIYPYKSRRQEADEWSHEPRNWFKIAAQNIPQ
ncbi:MAG: NUDIX domain-containing protein [Hydrococcus sp. RU_2_2]|nr:NUDIX domain-containing protein [Hydrococcus sp. RU_2_2]NJP18276.1 NUDIX domain-containing protein [Hydrococcus sp. CRU_1_1]